METWGDGMQQTQIAPAQTLQQSARLYWVDAAKFLGILMIYYGHFAGDGGRAYLFVYEFHVPFFFLLSGFFAASSLQKSFWPYLRRRSVQLLVPYVGYSVLTVLVLMQSQKWNLQQLIQSGIQICLGVDYWQQSSCVAVAGRWFLICLFEVSVIYQLLSRVVHHRFARLMVCTALYLAGTLLLGYDVLHYPRVVWGADRAVCYMMYYCMGDCLFPAYKQITRLSSGKRLALLAALAGVGIWIFLFGSSSVARFLHLQAALPRAILQIVLVIALCTLFVMLAQLLPECEFIRCCGSETLILCSCEQIIRAVLETYLIASPYALLISSLFMLAMGVYVFVPLTKKLFELRR